MVDSDFQPIMIRYDGLDTSQHRIELGALGESLQGASRLLGVAANYVATGRYVKKLPALSVRILAQETRAECFEVVVMIATLTPGVQPALPFFVKLGSKVVEYIVNFIVAKFSKKPDHMERALGLIETALRENGQTSRAAIDGMRATVEAMAQGQRTAVRQFAAPVGDTCDTARLGSLENAALPINREMKDAITAPDEIQVSAEKTIRVLISELDMQTGGCKVTVEGDDEPDKRHLSEITDPAVKLANNPYAAAMAAQKWLSVRAKAQSKDGELDRFYISDIAA